GNVCDIARRVDIRSPNSTGIWRVPPEYLLPMPPTKTPEEQAVIDAAEVLFDNSRSVARDLLYASEIASLSWNRCMEAVATLRAGRPEPHPVQALLDALRADPDATIRHRRAIEKVEAAKLGWK
ncbi:MAG: hypothetical protein KGL35_01270, partial [Bradyrhizobium sp.]|nr:hypothetical protein [Bradyrhizobium sp.]